MNALGLIQTADAAGLDIDNPAALELNGSQSRIIGIDAFIQANRRFNSLLQRSMINDIRLA